MMDTKTFFNAEEYFSGICAANKLAKEHKFTFCTCSGINSLQGMLDNFKRANAFFCLDDTNDGALLQGRGGGFFKRRVFTVFILHRYRFGDMADRAAKLATCRDLFRQTASRMLKDSRKLMGELTYLNTDNVKSRELGQYFMNGCTGLYFMVDVDEPVDLKFHPEEWTS